MMSLQSALVGYGIFKALPSAFGLRPLSVKENVRPERGPPCMMYSDDLLQVVLQTTAVACGTMPLAAGMLAILE
jgi:hypothetical protein